MREVTIICRLSSKEGVNYYKRLQEELPKRDVKIVEAHMVKSRKQLKKRIRQAMKSKKKYIVVVGGDGTQTAAVAEMAHSDSIMCVVPAGTGNSFALGLGISADIEKAIDTIATGKEMRIDVGCVNGTHFANFATIGVLAEACRTHAKAPQEDYRPGRLRRRDAADLAPQAVRAAREVAGESSKTQYPSGDFQLPAVSTDGSRSSRRRTFAAANSRSFARKAALPPTF